MVCHVLREDGHSTYVASGLDSESFQETLTAFFPELSFDRWQLLFRYACVN